MDRRVVVSGVGIVSAAGVGVGETWERLRCRPPRATPYTPPCPAHRITFPAYQTEPYSLGDLGLSRRTRRWLEHDGLFEARDVRDLLAGTALALADAGLPLDCGSLEPPLSVVVADESPGFEQLSQALFRFGLDGAPPVDPLERYSLLVNEFFHLNTFLLPHYLARTFGFHGTSLFVNSACTSGLNAVDLAAHEVRCGRSRIALAAASEDTLSVAKYLWFRGLGLYSQEGVIRPFDGEPPGTVFGSGGAALVLEGLESARRRGARVYAEYLGSGFTQDGWKISVPSPLRARTHTALEEALKACALAPSEIDLVVPHGVGTAASDQYESMVLHRVFGRDIERPAITALKPYVGHTLGGSALVDLAILLAAMERSAVPATLGQRTPLPHRPLPLVDEWIETPIRTAVKLSAGFAGFHGASVFRRVEEGG